jgi:hypothetical protein
MHTIVRKFPQYVLTGGQGRMHLCLYEPADPIGSLWAKRNIESRNFMPLINILHECVDPAVLREQLLRDVYEKRAKGGFW